LLFQVFFLIVAAVTAIALGLWAFAHVGRDVLPLLFLPTLISGAMLSVGYLVGLANHWIRSKRTRTQREGSAIESQSR